jgi:KDO2-lipid IV(A) lauroyltransferase
MLAGALRRLPKPVGRAFLRGLAGIAWAVLRKERGIARSQLARAFPDLAPARRDAVARASLRSLGDNLLDMLRADAAVSFPAADRVKLEECLQRGPVLALMAHAGAWELLGPVLVQATGRFAAVTAEPHNAQLGAWLRREREARHIRCFDRDREVAAAARWLAGGGCLAVLADHRPRGQAVEAPWFDYPAPTAAGPARLARIAGASILPVGIRRVGDGHEMSCGAAFAPSGNPQADAARCNQALEELILASPEEWTWFHNRYE